MRGKMTQKPQIENRCQKIYGFDKVEIDTKLPVNDLRKLINKIRPIPKEQGEVYPEKYSREVKLKGYCSTMRLIAPTKELLLKIKNLESLLGRYCISLAELCEDRISNSVQEAIELTDRMIAMAVKMNGKDASDHFRYDRYITEQQVKETFKEYALRKKIHNPTEADYIAWENRIWNNQKPKHMQHAQGKYFNRYTLYLGEDSFQFVIYARHSKFTEKPCVHSEWRIAGRYLKKEIQRDGVKEKVLSISTISDLQTLNIAHAHQTLTKKFIKFCEIDKLKVGKWVDGCEKKQIWTPYDAEMVQLAYQQLRSAENIVIASDFYEYARGKGINPMRYLRETSL